MDTAPHGGSGERMTNGLTSPQPRTPRGVSTSMKANAFFSAPAGGFAPAWALAVLLPVLGAATLASAAAPNVGKSRRRPAAAATANQGAGGAVEALKIFDKNEDQRIDGEELTALQNSFGALKKLDANGNGEIEPEELERLNAATAAAATGRPAVSTEERKGRALGLMGLQEVDKNGNRQVDPEEVADLEKLLGGGRVMERLDQNNNGKLEPDEVKQLNERLGQRDGSLMGALRSRFGGSSSRSASPAPEPAAPASPFNVPRPIVPPKPEDERPAPAPMPEAKPEVKPEPAPLSPFPSSGLGPKPPGGFGT